MDVAVRYITQEHPVGAYAVSQIKHEIGTSSGVQAVALQITYSRSIAQIQKLQSVSGLVEAKDMIASALEKCEASVVFYMDSYDGTDFVQFVSDYVDDNPDKCMELPQISAMSYPETGTSRVIELVFSYQTSRDTLRSMQQNVADVFESAELFAVFKNNDSHSRTCESFFTCYRERTLCAECVCRVLCSFGSGSFRSFCGFLFHLQAVFYRKYEVDDNENAEYTVDDASEFAVHKHSDEIAPEEKGVKSVYNETRDHPAYALFGEYAAE
jgi:hypothetical protein